MTISLTLPYPVSANRYWAHRVVTARGAAPRAMVYVTQEAKVYRHHVLYIAMAHGVKHPLSGRVHVSMSLYPERPQDWERRHRKDPRAWDDGVRCLDLDNARKVVYDALIGPVLQDDKQVWSDQAERMEPDEHGARVVLFITQLAGRETPQRALFDQPTAASEQPA